MNMEFVANKTPVEVIKEWAFGGTYFRERVLWIKKDWSKLLLLNF